MPNDLDKISEEGSVQVSEMFDSRFTLTKTMKKSSKSNKPTRNPASNINKNIILVQDFDNDGLDDKPQGCVPFH